MGTPRRGPANGRIDSTLALLRAPYTFVGSEAGRLGSDVFEARLMLGPATCMVGPRAAALFYRSDLFTRVGAMPPRITSVLFGAGGVQQLDGERHRDRKRLFMEMMSTEELDRLSRIAAETLDGAAATWAARGEVELYEAATAVLMRAACAWAGIPLAEDEIGPRTAQMRTLFEAAGKIGPAHWRGRRARREADAWARGLIRGLRAGRIAAPEGSPARRIAEWTEQGAPLSEAVAAVELLNVIRPTVAVGVFVAFLAHALHAHPQMAARVGNDAAFRHAFVQEVRRHYPFFPLLSARARQDITWEGLHIPAGRRVVLDLYGTDHHAEAWEAPDAFRPERFVNWPGDAFAMVPQGGGEHHANHRCPGEWITIRMMELFAETLTTRLVWRAEGDIAPDMGAIPALPRKRVPLAGLALR